MKRLTSALTIVAACVAVISAHATPFASCISNINNTIYFNLNEPGGNVTVTYEDGSTNASFDGKTTGLNLPRGYQHFDFTGHTSYNISVYKIGSGSPSIVTNVARSACRGIAANVNGHSPFFGYVYSVIGGAGAVVMRSDGSGGAAGNPFPGSTLKPAGNGVVWGSGSSGTQQYFISVAPDDYVLISDYGSDAAGGSEGGIIRVNPTFTSSALLLANITGLVANDTADFNHGTAESRAILTAPIGQNPTLYVVDGTWESPFNQILKYNLGTADYDNNFLMPWATAPDAVLAEVNPPAVQGYGSTLRSGLSIGTNGYFYVSVDRANLSNPNLQVYAADGTTLLWNSFYTNSANQLKDYTVTGTTQLPETGSGPAESALSPDNRYIALVHDDNHITVFTLTNGVPDITTEYLITGLGTSGFGRSICWDAANNLWMASSGLGQVYHYSVGRTATAVTTGNATGPTGFTVLSPTEVDIASVQALAPQANSYANYPLASTNVVTRTGDVSSPLSIPYTLTGTAPNGTYTVSTTGTINFAAGQTSTNVVISAVTDGIPRPTTTVIMTLTDNRSGQYIVGFQNQATTFIVNTATPQLVNGVGARTMYKAYSNDYTSISVTRWGDTNVTVTSSAFTYSGAAVRNTDFTTTGTSIGTTVSFAKGDLTKTVRVARPLVNGQTPVHGVNTTTYTGDKTFTVTIPTGTGYVTYASNNAATLTIVDSAYPASTVLFSDPLTDPNDSTNWNITAMVGDSTQAVDYNVDFGYDLTGNNPNAGNVGLIPLPPSGATSALRMTCNKINQFQASAVNAYLTNHLLSGDYAMRFSMYIEEGQNVVVSSANGTGAAEGPMFGINHDGKETNWWYSSGVLTGGPWSADGVWYWITAEPAWYSSDMRCFTGVSNNIPNSGWRSVATTTFSGFQNIYKNPQDFTCYGTSTNAVSGVPANASSILTPNSGGKWADVEIVTSNNVVKMNINHVQVFSMNNTNSLYQQGYPMFGYEVPNAENAGPEAAVYFSDLKIVSLAAATPPAAPTITNTSTSNGNVVINFTTTTLSDTAANFTVQTESIINGGFADVIPAATITGSSGSFQATVPVTGATQFYRIKR